MKGNLLYQSLDDAGRTLRGLTGLVRVAIGAAAVVTCFAVVAWLVRSGWITGPEWVVAAWLVSGAVIAAAMIAARRAMTQLSPHRIGAVLEADGSWRHGALTTLLDVATPGTSPALHEHATALRAGEIRDRASAALKPRVLRQRVLGRRGVAALSAGLVLLMAARPATGATSSLWHPVKAVLSLVAPVQLHARRASVARGERVTLDIDVAGHREATLRTRAPGEGWRSVVIPLDANGHATYVSPPLDAELFARAEASGRTSGEVHVALQLAAFLGGLSVTAHYPAYLGLEDEALTMTGDTLVLPEGTALSVRGRATAPLDSALLIGTPVVPLQVSGMSFEGKLLPRASGSWQLRATLAGGAALAGEMPQLPIRIVPDSAPVVEIPLPGADTVAASSMSLGLIIGVRDDHGITGVAIESRRGSRAPTRTTLALPAGTQDRALITTALDLTALGLLPGDTLRYVAVAEDNAPAHHIGRSREYVIRIPTINEQRAARAAQTTAASAGLDSLSKQSARVQRAEEDLARARQRTDSQGAQSAARPDGQKAPLASDAARKASAAAQSQQKLIEDATKVQRSLQELQQAAQRQGASDSALARQLSDINKLLDKALSPDLLDKLNTLQQAIKNLDAEQTQQSLADMAKRQAQLKDALDQARELFKRAALETSLADLGHDAKQLAEEQQAATTRVTQHDSAASNAERDLAKRADSLAAGLERAAAQVAASQPKQDLQQAAKQARDAGAKMQQAAKSAQDGAQQDAESQAHQAEQQLNPLSKQIDQDRQSMQAEMRAEVKQALDRALDETARLATRQLAVLRSLQQGTLTASVRNDQGLVEEGAGKLQQQVTAVSAMNALVSPNAAVALAEARRLMQEAVESLSVVNPNTRDAVDRIGDATDALTVAAFSLMQSKDKVNGSQSGSGVSEAMQQMQQMAGKQGQLAQQGQGMMGNGQLSAQQLMQMAMQQRMLAQQLDRMRAGGQLPGMGQLAREAHDLSRSLESGQLNTDVVDRQQRLFKKMLDAGRTLQGQEDDDKKERQSMTAKDGPLSIPPALDARLRNGNGEIKLPGWEAMQHLSPEERRRVVDYFQRLTQIHQP